MFSKILVADRGEIATRAFRAAYESGAETVTVYPGYGFLSENPELAAAAAAAGITSIGPGRSVLETAGDKATAKEKTIAAGVPVLKSTPASRDLDELMTGADAIGATRSRRDRSRTEPRNGPSPGRADDPAGRRRGSPRRDHERSLT